MADMFDKAYVEKLKSEEKYNDLFEYCNKLSQSSNDVEALTELSICYYHGYGIKQNYTYSLYYSHRAAYLGSSKAMAQLGYLYGLGLGTPVNKELSVRYFEQAAQLMHLPSLYNLYKINKDDNKNVQYAMQLLKTAATCGYKPAQIDLAKHYYVGEIIEQDLSKAIEWFNKAAEQGDTDALFTIAECYYFGEGIEQNHDIAVELWSKSAELGHSDSQYNFAICYEKGEGVEQSYAKAFKWYSKAAEQGHAKAQYCLANCYYLGKGVKQNHIKSIKWYIKAAEQGLALAQYDLGICYYLGEGVKANKYIAVEYFSKAAQQEESRALFALGMCYLEGEGVRKDKKKAIELFQKAFKQGNLNAANILKDLDKSEICSSKSSEENFVILLEEMKSMRKELNDIHKGNTVLGTEIEALSTKLDDHDKKVNEKLDTILQLARKIDSERAQLKKELEMQNKADLSDDDKAEIAKKLTDYILENVDISANKPNLSAVEAELKNIFGDTWNKLHSFTKTSLKSARLLWQQCMDMPASADFDYSGICICATAALENELKIHFFDNFQKYLLDTVGKPSEMWPETLLYIGYDKEKDETIYRAKYDKFFSIGTIKYLFDEADAKAVCDEYLETILKNKHSNITPTEHFTTQLFGDKSFVQRCEELREYRNRAAHSGRIDYYAAERCYYEIADKIDAREHTENINNILICLFEIIK